MADKQGSWYLFTKTGLPEAYLLYAAGKEKDGHRVHANQRSDHTRNPLQGKR